MKDNNNKKNSNSEFSKNCNENYNFSNKRFEIVTKEKIPELPVDEVVIARLRKIKDPKIPNQARKIQFFETLTINNYDFDLTLIALKLDLLIIQDWIVNDKYFRNLTRRYLCGFREILKLRLLGSIHKGGYKIKDSEILFNRLPEFAEEVEKEESSWVAVLPFILSEDADMVDGTIPLAEGKKIVKIEVPI
jgi:hypothetical protein